MESLKDIRDKAIFSVLFYSWCRVSALINLTVSDYYERGGTRILLVLVVVLNVMYIIRDL